MMFSDRNRPSQAFEKVLIEHLNKSGWCAFPFGQCQLPEECRHRLARFEDGARRPSLIRWMPDVITFRDLPNGHVFVALIDAKVCGQTENYAIEMSAVETAEIYTDRLYTPAFFVFDDWRLMTPREVRQRGWLGPDPKPGRGSGTPYLLVHKRHGRPFHDVFTPVAAPVIA